MPAFDLSLDAPTDASYVVIALDGTLTAERSLAVTALQIAMVDGGANGPVTLSLAGPHAFTTLTDGGILLGTGTGAIHALGVATNGQIPIGDGATDPVLNEIDGTANQVTVTNGAGSITLSLAGPHAFTTLTDNGLLLGAGTGPIEALGNATNGQIPIGSTGAAPVLAAITGTANGWTVDAVDSRNNASITGPNGTATLLHNNINASDGIRLCTSYEANGSHTHTWTIAGTRGTHAGLNINAVDTVGADSGSIGASDAARPITVTLSIQESG